MGAIGVPAGVVNVTAARRRVRCAVQRQAEEAVDMPAPGVELLAGRLGIGIDDGGGGADALQPDGLPHNHHLVVSTGWNDDYVAGSRGVDARLDGGTALSCARCPRG